MKIAVDGEDYIKVEIIENYIEEYEHLIECEESYFEQGVICEEEYNDRVKMYKSYIFILKKLLED